MAKKKVENFGLGELVEWSSQAGGCNKRKVGSVVAIVEAGVTPWQEPGLYDCSEYKRMFDGYARKHKSYLVSVLSKSGRGKAKLYWPHAGLLHKF